MGPAFAHPKLARGFVSFPKSSHSYLPLRINVGDDKKLQHKKDTGDQQAALCEDGERIGEKNTDRPPRSPSLIGRVHQKPNTKSAMIATEAGWAAVWGIRKERGNCSFESDQRADGIETTLRDQLT